MAGDAGLIGRLALKRGMITRDQLREATREQGRHPDKRIGEILVALGIIDEAQLALLLAMQSRLEHRRKPAMRRDTPVPVKRPAPEGVQLGAIALKRVPSSAVRNDGGERTAPSEPPVASELSASVPLMAKPVPMALPRVMAAKPEPLSETARWLQATLADAVSAGASDVLLQPERAVRMRRFGRLHDLTHGPVAAAACDTMLSECLDDRARDDLARDGQATLMFDAGDAGRFRTSVYHAHGGCCGVFHRVPALPPTLDSLGLPSALAKLTTFSSGLVLLSGPTGAGKSSTLAALVHLINEEREDHIVVIERAAECVHAPRVGLVSQLELGRHAATIASALHAAMCEDADVVAVDPLDDATAVEVAVSAADGGQLVIATVATRSAIRAIEYLIDAYPPAQQPQACAWLASSLRAVVSQRLVPASDDQGVVVALEVVYIDDVMRRAIRARQLHEIADAVRVSPNRDNCGLDDWLVKLVRTGHITADIARAQAHNPHNFRA